MTRTALDAALRQINVQVDPDMPLFAWKEVGLILPCAYGVANRAVLSRGVPLPTT
ncbi:hypothetical protein [Deinococcus ruber]|uniref:Uncharacterized protein n=1 Tax=Deinococcus ruber TaxID=1848197 RepID=A0A918CFM2_9DEIO|nr:hypothetical protein [Deinococcus ruber]GGR19924.1 hypothetical protein GCM10008957_35390 [Deinococcus ruber]